MGYLDNSSITVDAILTKKGRELLAKNDGSFNITQFALGDDEIDYSLYNENHPNGSQYSGEAIENMPILEAFPDGNNIMKHKLITLPRNTTQLPIIAISNSTITLGRNGVSSISPQTLNYNGNNSQAESGYIFTAMDARLFSSFGSGDGNSSQNQYNASVKFSETVSNLQTLNFVTLSGVSLFGTNSQLITVITVEGMDSGARATVLVKINKEATAINQAETGQTATVL